MRLYHSRFFLLVGGFLLFTACVSPPQVHQGSVEVILQVDGQLMTVSLAPGSTVKEVLDEAGIEMGLLDRVEPPEYTVLADGSEVRVIRVTEEYEVVTVVIPFEHQTIQSDTLPEGETRLIQPGVNGAKEITYRKMLEDGAEVSNEPVKTVVVAEPVAEIVIVGSQTPFAPIKIPGRLAFLANGNAWVMEGTTTNRRPLVTTGDLDGRVFELSPDGRWLLFTRKIEADEEAVNGLWVVSVGEGEDFEFDLGIKNVIHFAAWSPRSEFTVAYSTVEPRTASPGWQANNDLGSVSFSLTDWVSTPQLLLPPNAGGIYGWWGTNFAWSTDGVLMAYARPDSVGLFDEDNQSLLPLLENPPFHTTGDWAWVPGMAWGANGQVLYTVAHAYGETGIEAESSTRFDLMALPIYSAPVVLVPNVGMFAYPAASPLQSTGWDPSGFQVAFLQAIFPDQSLTSRYRLVVMDRDGSNRRVLFPEPGAPGMEPHRLVWSPSSMGENGSYNLALIYQNNLWLVNSSTGIAHQVTGDGFVEAISWR
ncbi:MAG: G5 domain-containing protein [Chloroflexota bacterium]